MNKLYIFIFFSILFHGNVFGQRTVDLNFASSMEGYYSGSYISRKKIEKNAATLFLKSEKGVIKVNKSIFGPFHFKVKFSDTDTLHFNSSIKGMKIKYIKSSKRISLISMLDSQIVNFNGKFSHKDAADLEKKKSENEARLALKRGKIYYYGKFFGTLTLGTEQRLLDTIIITQLNKKYEDGNLLIEENHAIISSSHNNFKPFETPLKITNSGQLILANKNSDLVLRLNYENQTLYFVHKSYDLRFEGIEVEGQTK